MCLPPALKKIINNEKLSSDKVQSSNDKVQSSNDKEPSSINKVQTINKKPKRVSFEQTKKEENKPLAQTQKAITVDND